MKTKFFTGKGDDGTSDMGGGVCMNKDSGYAELLGALDELNSWTGLCRARAAREHQLKKEELPVAIVPTLRQIQELLFIAQAEIAVCAASALGIAESVSGNKHITPRHTTFLEEVIHKVDKEVPPLTHFVIPGASELSAMIDVARVTARRVERTAVALHRAKKLPEPILPFLNRLSSVFFALARYINHCMNVPEEFPRYE